MMRTLMRFASPLLILVAMLATGCSTDMDSQGFFNVDGVVTFNGQPVDEGWIVFRSTDGTTKNVAAPIQRGKFEVKIQEGIKLVEISAEREVPGKYSVGPNGEKVPAKESIIPAIYNTKSTLKTTVSYPVNTPIEFSLKDA